MYQAEPASGVMLCPNCHHQVARGAPYCTVCGTSVNGAPAVFDLVLSDQSRMPVVAGLTLGRASTNTVQLADPSISRRHARITPANGSGLAPVLEDLGSSYGTWLDGSRLEGPRELRDGSRIRLGNRELLVERRRGDAEPARTIVVPAGASLVLDTRGHAALDTATSRFGIRPRLRSGYALKRLAASEGENRWILKRFENEQYLQFSDANAGLLDLLDGKHSLQDLIGEAEQRFGDGGTARLASLLSELSEGGFLAEVDDADGDDDPVGRRNRLFRPRERAWPSAGRFFERVYERGGWILFTRPALAGLATLALAGAVVFALLVIRRYGTPFVVANKVGIGGLIFLLGRSLVIALHESAHALTMTSFGRTPGRAGVKAILVFPYAFVDVSDMWFEPRLRRIAVSAAGPASDFVLGGAFSICCLVLPPGTTRDILFQLAFAAYVGGIFNLSPLLERDGYYILVDALREPGLRGRARQYLSDRLSGRGAPPSKGLARYAYISLAWTLLSATFVAAMSLRYEAALTAVVPRPLSFVLLGSVWVLVILPALAMVVPPIVDRLRRRRS
jgi:putative peptide zinc metalloprotease protein